MARYSQLKTKPTKPVELAEGIVLNEAGGAAYAKGTKEEIVSILINSLMGDKYYEKAEDTEKRLRTLTRKNPYFAAQAAIYARNVHGMRSVSHVVATEIVDCVKGEAWTRRAVDKIVFRVDDMTEILALWIARNGKRKIPNSLKKGLAEAFDKFDAYQLAKYKGERREVSLIDVVNLVHPKPGDKNREALKQLVNGTLVSKDTWEAKLSAAGQATQNAEEKAELKNLAWQDLVVNRKIGYLALLRNLRNIEQQADPMVLKIALEMLVNEKLVKNSKIFPFQFMSAYNQVSNREILSALNKAIDISLSNIPNLGGSTLIAVDHSGSMGHGIGSNKFIGDLFAAAFYKKNPTSDLIVFGTTAGYARLDAETSTLSLAEKIGREDHGGGTNMSAIFEVAKKGYDRVIIFTDEQSWIGGNDRYANYYGTNVASAFNQWRADNDVDPYVYAFDLGGYATKQFASGKTIQLGGFSDKIFDLMESFEVDPRALIAEVEKVVI